MTYLERLFFLCIKGRIVVSNSRGFGGSWVHMKMIAPALPTELRRSDPRATPIGIIG